MEIRTRRAAHVASLVVAFASFGAAQTSTSSAGTCLAYDGVDDFVGVARSVALEPGEITIELWARLDGPQDWNTRLLRKGLNDAYFITCDQDLDQRMQVMYTRGSQFRVWAKDPQPHTVYVGEWHHFLGIYALDHLEFWVDGVQVASEPHSLGAMTHLPLTDLCIGAGLPVQMPNEYFDGRIDEVRLWNYPRTPAEIAATWNRTVVGNEPGLVARWSFDEGAGQIAHDSTSFAHHGTLGATSSAGTDDPTWLVSDAPIQPGGCAVWNLAADFRIAPDHANPNPDACGTAGVWHFLGSAASGSAHDPTGYWLLPEFLPDVLGVLGVEQWQGYDSSGGVKNKLPAVGINATGVHQTLEGIQWPAGVVRVHPSSAEAVVVGWQSPVAGVVAVSGGLRDLHTGCTDGVSWSVDRYDGTPSVTLASDYLPGGGVQSFASGSGGSSLASITVAAGDWLFFVVERGADNGCDSIGLDVVIAPPSPCPPPTSYCIGAINTTGKGAAIGSHGSTSVAANELVLDVQGCPPTKPGVFFFGAFQNQIPFGEGYLCVTGGQKRLPIVVTGVDGTASFALDFNDPSSPASLITAGSQWNFQFWYRDPQLVGHGFNLSDALHAEFCK
ncbi:MAG: LamG domain-containing protein [Planctomycetes bacterium]|nr:LamG domain-containing protein [Planctomycetota bacterium]